MPRKEDDEVPIIDTDEADEGCEKPAKDGDVQQTGFWCMRPRFIVVEPLLVLYIVAGMPMMSVTSQWMFYKVAEEMNITIEASSNDTSSCSTNMSDPMVLNRQLVQQETAKWNMYLSLAHFLPGLLSPIIIGTLGDRIGRRIILILPIIGSISGVLVYMAVIYFDLSIYWLFLSGVEYWFGSHSTLFLGAFAYLADTVEVKKRAFRMTLVDVVSISNGAIADLVIGYWINASGYFYPLIFVVCGKTLALLYAIFCVPETLKKVQKEEVKKEAQGLKSKCAQILGGMQVCLYDNGEGRRWKINLLLFAFAFSEIISTHSVQTIYEMNQPFCWSPVTIGYYSSVTMLTMCAAMAIAAKIPERWISAEWKVAASKLSAIARAVCFAFATSSALLFIAPVVGSLSFLGIPMVRVILSRLVSQTEQASVFAMMSSSKNMADLSSTMLSNELYAWAVAHWVGIFFLTCAAIYAISFLIILFYIYKVKRDKPVSIHADIVVTEGSRAGNIQAA